MSLDGVSDEELLQSLPRGVRNRNPGNIEDGDFARSLPGYKGSDGRFAIFDSMDNGVGAQARLLGSYGKRGINTVEGVVNRWAPKTENDTGAYVNVVARKLGVDPRAPLDMNDPNVLDAMADAMAEHENGVAVRAPKLTDVSDEELLASLGDQAKPRPAAPPIAPGLPPPTAGRQQPQTSQALGFAKGVAAPVDRLFDRMDANPMLDKVADLTGQAFPMFNLARTAVDQGVDKLAMPAIAKAEAAGARPGKIGEFAGNVAVSLPSGMTGMRSALSGALTGGLMSEKDDALGVLGDAGLGAVFGRLGDATAQGAGALARAALSKAPKVMSGPELAAAAKAAYKAVDDSGFTFPKAAAQNMAAGVETFLAKKGGKTLYPEASQWVKRLKELSSQKGGLPISQLDDLRGDIYTALVKPGGKDSVIGTHMRQEIDKLISSAAGENQLIKTARDLYARSAKTGVVTKRLESADLARGRAYTGKNTDNTIRQKLSPLIDPLHNSRLRNATADEANALEKVVTGGKGQNLVRTAGTLLDPRGVIGMGLQATGAAKSGGLTLASIPLGLLSTAASGRMSQKNVESLLRLIAVGGSKEALKKAPTAASRTAEKVTSAARPALTTAGAAMVIQPQPKKTAK